MAELNELLRQAAEEAEGLAQEALRAREAVARLGALTASLGEGLEAGAAEAQALVQGLAARLTEAEAELTRESAAAVGSLRTLQAVSSQLHQDTGRFLGRVQGQLEELRAEKDRVLSEVDAGSEAAAGALGRYTARLDELEAVADGRLAESRRQIEALSQQAADVRQRVGDRGQGLLAQVYALGENAHRQLEGLLESYDSVAAGLEEQVGAIQALVKSRSEDAAVEMTRRLSREALEALSDAMAPLRDALAGLEAWGDGSKDRHHDHLSALAGSFEGVTRILDGLKGPLSMVRQQLN